MGSNNGKRKLRLVAHISPELKEKLNQYVKSIIEKGIHREHGALSFVVERAIKQFLDEELKDDKT